ncbi:hypothetical protein EYF80_035808 [Liparis tanakae]|uniref:Uncharacterized protein n=1 Tax=Liparis tanakae TaxID=230148 RepID=A0A4Z2GMG7_9TELE|nr:hypothetical protein EYF80_035808 [Liparis tanakae]
MAVSICTMNSGSSSTRLHGALQSFCCCRGKPHTHSLKGEHAHTHSQRQCQSCMCHCNQQTVFRQGFSLLHYDAQVIIHPQKQSNCGSQKSFQACRVRPEDAERVSRYRAQHVLLNTS